jgi:8-oxo-dGTP diphosphatase
VIHVVGAAILHSGRCLVAQRSEAMSMPLSWEFPGGKIEPGESPEAALARELVEELGIEIEVGARIGRGEAEVAGRLIRLDVYRAKIVAGTPVAREHARVAWLAPDELASLAWAEADLPIVPRVLAALG